MEYEFISRDNPKYEQVVKLRHDTFLNPITWDGKISMMN